MCAASHLAPRRSVRPHLAPMFYNPDGYSSMDLLPTTAEIDAAGRLLIGGCALERIAEVFGTPAFVVDELALRETARTFREAFLSWHADTRVCFASKAFPCSPVLRVL